MSHRKHDPEPAGRSRFIGRGPVLGYTAVAAGLFLAAGCDGYYDGPDAQYGGVCVDKVTQQRVDDARCDGWAGDGFYDGPGSYMMWYPMSYRGAVPAIGEYASGGVLRVPPGTPIAAGVPRGGASAASGGMTGIQRGGFGARSGTTEGSAGHGGSGGS